MATSTKDDAAKRDAVLRRMLATPKPGKGEKDGGPRAAPSARGAEDEAPTKRKARRPGGGGGRRECG